MPGVPNPTPTSPTHWRCPTCCTLLGIADGGVMEVRYKSAVYFVRGELRTLCRRCGNESVFETGSAAPPASHGR